MIHAWLFYSGQKHITTYKKTVFECIRWAQSSSGNPHALILLLEIGDDTQTIEYHFQRKNGRQSWMRIKGVNDGLLVA